MSQQLLRTLTLEHRPTPARFRSGQTVRVSTKVIEGGKTRIQIFEGVIIAVSGSGPSRSITVRKISFNKIGVERTFPLFSPLVEKVEIVDQAKVRRAKLSFLREERPRKLRGKKPVGVTWSGAAVTPAAVVEASVEASAEEVAA